MDAKQLSRIIEESKKARKGSCSEPVFMENIACVVWGTAWTAAVVKIISFGDPKLNEALPLPVLMASIGWGMLAKELLRRIKEQKTGRNRTGQGTAIPGPFLIYFRRTRSFPA